MMGAAHFFESVMVQEVGQAFKDFIKQTKGYSFVLIGGLALSYYVKPRTTMDGDTLWLTTMDIPDHLEGFKRQRKEAFEHKQTGVEIEVLTPEYINMDQNIAKTIVKTAIERDGVRIASVAGLIVSKLKRFSRQDQADIEALIKFKPDVHLDEFDLPQELISRFFSIKNEM